MSKLFTLARQVVAEQPDIGRRLLARELTEQTGQYISEKRARNLLDRIRTSSPAKPAEDKPPEPDKIVQLEVERLKAQRERQLLSETKRVLAVADIVAEKLAGAVANLPPIQAPPAIRVEHRGDAEDIVCLISDIQGGQRIDAEEMGGLNEYNIDVMKRRAWIYLHNIRRIVEERRRAGKQVRRIHVWLLGDIIEGEQIYRGQQWHIDQDVFDQAVTLSEVITNLLTALLELGSEVVVETIPGNHGRIGRKGESRLHVNFDNICYEYIRLRLAGVERIDFRGPHRSWYKIAEVLGWKFHLGHGDNVKGWGGIPFYGFVRAYSNDFMMLQLMKQSFQYWVCGDKHTQFTMDMGAGEIIANGNWVGTSFFSANQLHKGGRPSQTVFGVDEVRGVTWKETVFLDIEPAEVAA